MWHAKEASSINPACGHFRLALLGLFYRKTATSAYEALSIPLLSPIFFLSAEFARIYTILYYFTNKMECGQLSLSLRAIRKNIHYWAPVSTWTSAKRQWDVTSFLVSNRQPRWGGTQPVKSIIHGSPCFFHIPLPSGSSASSRSSGFVASSKSFAHSKGLKPLRRQISSSSSFVDRSGGHPVAQLVLRVRRKP